MVTIVSVANTPEQIKEYCLGEIIPTRIARNQDVLKAIQRVEDEISEVRSYEFNEIADAEQVLVDFAKYCLWKFLSL